MFCVQNQGCSEVPWWPTLSETSQIHSTSDFQIVFFIHVHSEPFICNSIFVVYRIRCMTPDLVPVIKDMNIWNKANLVSVGLQCWAEKWLLENLLLFSTSLNFASFVPFFSVSNTGKVVSIFCLTFKMTLKAFIIPQLWGCSINPWNEVWACLCHFGWCPA